MKIQFYNMMYKLCKYKTLIRYRRKCYGRIKDLQHKNS